MLTRVQLEYRMVSWLMASHSGFGLSRGDKELSRWLISLQDMQIIVGCWEMKAAFEFSLSFQMILGQLPRFHAYGVERCFSECLWKSFQILSPNSWCLFWMKNNNNASVWLFQQYKICTRAQTDRQTDVRKQNWNTGMNPDNSSDICTSFQWPSWMRSWEAMIRGWRWMMLFTLSSSLPSLFYFLYSSSIPYIGNQK